MSSLNFSLKPFKEGEIPGLVISGNVGRNGKTFFISYRMEGPLQEIALPGPAPLLERRFGLWEETCLEFFIRPPESSAYWEFNLSPAGHWNVFSFTSYREGIKEEPAFTSLPFRVQRGPEFLLSVEFALDKIIEAETKIQLAVSAVIKTKEGKFSYWALAHPGSKPDFHHKDGFVLGL